VEIPKKKLPSILLSANFISLILLDVSSTIIVVESEIGKEGNPVINALINVMSLHYAMFLRLVLGIICLILIWKLGKNHNWVIFAGLLILNIFYISIIFNNLFVLWGAT
jgi:hypothetical protein